MKKCIFTVLLVCMMAASACTGDEPAEEKKAVTLESDADRVSYALGLDIANTLKQQNLDINPDVMAQGLSDGLSGGETLMAMEEVQTTLAAWQQEMQQKQAEEAKKLAEENRVAGEAFLEENKAKEGVQVTDSGLQYKVLEEGDGPTPTLDDTVKAHYKGTLVDGTVFDSSYERGEPATFPLKGLIPGWQEALTMMPVGSKWELYVPADLAYGDRQAGQQIKPGSTLVFEIELLEILSNETDAAAEQNATAE